MDTTQPKKQRTPEQIARKKEYDTQYNLENIEMLKIYKHKYQQEHKEQLKLYMREYRLRKKINKDISKVQIK